ncbi:MAG TPA: antitoxin Xre/MbcA/ParS toxin-binding domain-containing protein [Frateuria sp.]|uniref:antitoxin Xre/MbcA/ParS toxin-binding domain-containing protein n=1 Tax=Frateuria sp. TaxID=2211372 RepID=UPI002D803731|nr:antitoxin Xre/MbcA/ParS toxin-binding domain-containing protein [Frateuria sp.]HET6804119.1 antitoxin Xre/MbcA/ParS toxin-binding domain-containing protein [Frateuria sp.]
MSNVAHTLRSARSLSAVAEELRGLDRAREAAIQRAFRVLEEQHGAVAHLVLQFIGDRDRAARWMCMHQRAFGGRSAYDLLADGDIDTVCDRLYGQSSASQPTMQVGCAY